MEVEEVQVSEIPRPDHPDTPEHVEDIHSTCCGFQSFLRPCSTQVNVKTHPVKLAGSVEFGASLNTISNNDEDVNKLKTYKHFVINIKEDSVAEQVKLSDHDELITIEDEFVPNDKHDAVLECFKKEQAGGYITFHLIVRRETRDGGARFYEISARLSWVSEDTTHRIIEARNTRLTLIRPRGNQTQIQVLHMYRIQGTSKYMKVTPTAATADQLLGNDIDNRVVKISNLNTTGPIPSLKVALASYDRKWYISVTNGNTVGVTNTETWFKQIKRGTDVRFMYNGKYLAYDERTDRLVLASQWWLRLWRRRYRCVFEEIVPRPAGDEVDGSQQEIDSIVIGLPECNYANSAHQMDA